MEDYTSAALAVCRAEGTRENQEVVGINTFILHRDHGARRPARAGAFGRSRNDPSFFGRLVRRKHDRTFSENECLLFPCSAESETERHHEGAGTNEKYRDCVSREELVVVYGRRGGFKVTKNLMSLSSCLT